MLTYFSVANWRSFKDKCRVTLEAPEDRQHEGRGPKTRKVGQAGTKVLPAAAIFGGNATGKTSFVLALLFARDLVTQGCIQEAPVDVDPFLLDKKTEKKPSSFVFGLAIGEDTYEYSFKVTHMKVQEEKLVKTSSKPKVVLFDRKGTDISFDWSVPEKEPLKSVVKSTALNQLLLSNTVLHGEDIFRPIYDWFAFSLECIPSDFGYASFDQFMGPAHKQNALQMNQAIAELDLGIDGLESEEIPLDVFPGSQELGKQLLAELSDGESTRLQLPSERIFAVATRKGKKIVVEDLVARHRDMGGRKTVLQLWQESDGAKRLIELLPIFLWGTGPGTSRTFVIDDLGRDLDTPKARKLLALFLSNCSKDSRSQLLFTTRDVMLMDHSLLGTNEMWVMERSGSGESGLLSVQDHEAQAHGATKDGPPRNRMGVPDSLLDMVFGKEADSQ